MTISVVYACNRELLLEASSHQDSTQLPQCFTGEPTTPPEFSAVRAGFPGSLPVTSGAQGPSFTSTYTRYSSHLHPTTADVWHPPQAKHY